MTQAEKLNALIYGTVSDHCSPQEYSTFSSRVKKSLHQYRDLMCFRAGYPQTLNYKNYTTAYAVNFGDVAICESTRSLISEIRKDTNYINVNWGNLSSCQQTSDAMVIAGSGYFHFDENGILASRLADDLAFVENYKNKIVILGIGINQSKNSERKISPELIRKDDAKLIKRLIAKAENISVRDRLTQSVLQHFSSKEIVLTGDPALFHQPCVEPNFQPNPTKLRIGVNFSFHGEKSCNLFILNAKKYIQILKTIKNTIDCEFLYFIHHEAERIIPVIFQNNGVSLTVISGSVNDLMCGYKTIDIHIGGMLHSCILATASGCPSIGLAYDIKHDGFYDLLDTPNQCFSAYNFDDEKIIDATLSILNNKAAQRINIQQKISNLRTNTLSFISNVL